MAILIGIDTGRDTGLAVWDSHRREFRAVATLPIHRALDAVRTWANDNPGEVVVYFEDARRRRWIPDTHDLRREMGRRQGAGSVKRDATIWEEALADWGIPFEAVGPHKGLTKWDAKTFAAVTGWTGRTSNHARDAALLVFGR